MGARSAIAVAVVALLVPGAGAGSAKSACSVPTLSKTVLRHGAASVRHFRELLARERGADLMGFRRGPRLKPPSAHERGQIEDARSLRRQFGLNPSTLLIRRLIRDRSHRSQVSFFIPPLKVTAREERDLRFRERVEKALLEVDRYVGHCARATYAGLYFDDDRPWPAEFRIVIRFKGTLAGHRAALRTRFRYHGLLPVRAARYSLRELGAAQARVDADWEEWKRDGFELNVSGIDEKRNAVVIGIANPSPEATAAFRDRYGAAVILEPLVIERARRGVSSP